MRLLGLDLGTKTLGVSLTDKTNTIVSPHSLIRFKSEDYESAVIKVIELINTYEISKVILGLPINMDGTYGFASERSMKFKELLSEKISIPIILEDERLTSVMANNILTVTNNDGYAKKDKVDALSACLILESYLKKETNND